MASNKKELCPICKTNQKGVDSKMCKDCNMNRWHRLHREKLAKKAEEQIAKNREEYLKKPEEDRVIRISNDGKYYL